MMSFFRIFAVELQCRLVMVPLKLRNAGEEGCQRRGLDPHKHTLITLSSGRQVDYAEISLRPNHGQRNKEGFTLREVSHVINQPTTESNHYIGPFDFLVNTIVGSIPALHRPLEPVPRGCW